MKNKYYSYIFYLFSYLFCLFSYLPAQDLLNGDYYMVQYIADENGGQGAMIIEVASQGAGSGSYRPLQTFGFEADSGTFDYSLLGNRTFTIEDSGSVLQGIIDDQGDVFSMVDSDTMNGFFALGIRKSSGRSVADLNGSYYVAEYHNGPSVEATAYDSIVFDGAGTAHFYRLALSINVDEDETPVSFSYTVDPDGRMTLNEEVIGALSADGSLFAVASTDSTRETSLAIGLKISGGHSNADLAGYFTYNEFRAENEADFSKREDNYARIYFDGEGNGQIFMISGNPGDEQFAYQIEADGGLFIDPVHGCLSADGRYIFAVDTHDSTDIGFGFAIQGGEPATAVQAAEAVLPVAPYLAQNFPNPFNPSTAITYRVARRTQINLSVYNLLGQKISELVSKRQPAGSYTVTWQGADFPSGIYFYVLRSGDGTVQTRKMMLLK
jgi:hypothetical protein